MGQSETLEDGTNRLSQNTVTNYQYTRHKIAEEQRSEMKVSRGCNVNLRTGPGKRWNWVERSTAVGHIVASGSIWNAVCAKAKCVLAKKVPFTHHCACAIFHYQRSVIWKITKEVWFEKLPKKCDLKNYQRSVIWKITKEVWFEKLPKKCNLENYQRSVIWKITKEV